MWCEEREKVLAVSMQESIIELVAMSLLMYMDIYNYLCAYD